MKTTRAIDTAEAIAQSLDKIFDDHMATSQSCRSFARAERYFHHLRGGCLDSALRAPGLCRRPTLYGSLFCDRHDGPDAGDGMMGYTGLRGLPTQADRDRAAGPFPIIGRTMNQIGDQS